MELLLYGVIGDPGFDAAMLVPMIRESSGDLTVRINSPGGEVFDGLAIYEALTAYAGGRVEVVVDGLAGSIASVIAMAGDTIVMADSAMMMVHEPWNTSSGNASTLRAHADTLDKIGRQLAEIYARRSKMPVARAASLMAAETWLSAQEAKAMGFADQIIPPLRAVALADLSPFNFRNIPDRLKGTNMPDAPAAPTQEIPAPAIITDRSPVATVGEVRQIVAQARLPETFALDLLERRLPVDQVRAAVIDHIAASAPEIRNYRPEGPSTFDNPGFHGQALADALYCRMSGRAPEGAAAAVMNLTMTDMAREMLEHRGVRGVRRMRPDEVFNLASQMQPRADYYSGGGGMMTTSDFPGLLQSAGQRFLMEMFEAAGSAIKQVGRVRSAQDFRAISVLKLSGAGVLAETPEAGEIERGKFVEGKEGYSVRTFSKIFALSRQALINDDLGAFSDPLRSMGRASAETEAQQLAGLLTANSGKGAKMGDNNALFHASHGNLAAAGAAPSVATLDVGRQALRAQKDTDGKTSLNATAKYILSGAAQETAVEQLLTAIMATQVSNVNPFAGKLTPLVDPRLDDVPWWLFADPAMMPVIEYAYLNGGGGPIVETRQGWDVLGTEYRVILDFGCGLVDTRGAYLNPGK